jgi:hypothetical protein
VPAVAFASELITAYSKAKVILVERDIESWYTSFDTAVVANAFSLIIWAVARIDPVFVRPLEQIHRKWARGWMRANSREEMRDNARKVYREHVEMVRRVTPKERLLVYRLGEGWGPLCEFLGKEVPRVEFPSVNDTDAMNEKIRLVAWRGVRNGVVRVGRLLGPVFVLVVAWWCFRVAN